MPDEGGDLFQMRLVDQPISRRSFNCLLAAFLVAAPRLAVTQGSMRVRRIGVLNAGVFRAELDQAEAAALAELGWVEGKNLHVERRYANERPEALNSLAEELVRAKVELIVTAGTAATLAAKRATTITPIVFQSAGDPVYFGLVASLARPGGNVTGFSIAGPDVTAKSLSLLKDLLPKLQRVGLLEAATNPYFRAKRGEFEQTCQLLGIAPVYGEIAAADDIEDAIARLARQRVQAVMLVTDPVIGNHRFKIYDTARKHGLPLMATASPQGVAEGGALVSYSPMNAEQDRRRASFIDRILHGAKPADLPVEQPTRFWLAINLKIARALKLKVPQLVLQRADEVIQ